MVLKIPTSRVVVTAFLLLNRFCRAAQMVAADEFSCSSASKQMSSAVELSSHDSTSALLILTLASSQKLIEAVRAALHALVAAVSRPFAGMVALNASRS